MDWSENKTWQYLNTRHDIPLGVLHRAEKELKGLDLSKRANRLNAIERQFLVSPHDGYTISGIIAERYGINRKQAGALYHLFHSKSSFLLNRQRQLGLHITHGTWKFSNSGRFPCDHQSLDGKRFSIAHGIDNDGEHIFPGFVPGCMCGYSPVLPGLDGEPTPKKRSWFARIFGRR